MSCLECAAADNREVPAVGVCRDCGAAMCLAHARIGHRAGHPAGTAGPAQSVSRELVRAFCATARPRARQADQNGVVSARPCDDTTCLC
jgi:hypothetical protein